MYSVEIVSVLKKYYWSNNIGVPEFIDKPYLPKQLGFWNLLKAMLVKTNFNSDIQPGVSWPYGVV